MIVSDSSPVGDRSIEVCSSFDKTQTHHVCALNDRNDIVSIAKGIGIIIVVLGHCTFGYAWLSLFISSFHMPLFFYLSGYFFSRNQII